MSTIHLAVVALSLVTLSASAQSLTPQVISPAGNYLTGSNGSLSFTLGETAVQNYTTADGSLTQGFQTTVSASNPLPLDFLSFIAKLINSRTQLGWITTHEINTDYFVVERSTDGQSFNPIATIAALNPANSSSDNIYQATDSLPLPGVDYYRLKEVDQNGQATYSPIVSVKVSNGLSCMIYPNPVIDNVYISINSNAAAQATIAIYDLRGQLITGKAIDLAPGQNQFELNITDKPKGIYLIKILGLDGLPTYSILKR
jgi:Secretion system C-terminal sorting domain